MTNPHLHCIENEIFKTKQKLSNYNYNYTKLKTFNYTKNGK